ncbi:MAG TPA: alpha-mannosidase [Firmicutes bacterium]|jgi:alpha-mannosidase|nr:alpha-mannosidase [Bacillota bacterium]
MPYAKTQMQAQISLAISKVKQAIYTIVGELGITAWVTSEPVPYSARMKGAKITLRVGDKWGELWDCAWFHFEGKIPPEAAGKKVVLLIDIGGEACVVDKMGTPSQGLTNISSEFDHSLGEPGKRVVFYREIAKDGETISLWADGGSNDLFGKYRDNGRVQAADIAICNNQAKKLFYDMKFLLELMQNLPESHARHDRILFNLYEAAMSLTRYTMEEMGAAQRVIIPELAKKSGDPSLFISALGHSHIDLAWLWPLRETVRKGVRTFATALMMMEHYPEYIFGASQAQLYQWMKIYYPELYQKVKSKVAEGRWEPLGALWVEADTNLPGGESLVRQLLYGKSFFQKEFAQTMKIAWLPDSFGYTAALPQLLKKAGVEYFCTTKLSWNLYDQFPHHTFIWQGLDESSVLVHMPPEGTYNSSAAPRAIVKAEGNYLDKGVSDQCLMLFGIGDGGGGPGEEHLEMLERERKTADLPPVRQRTAEEFFRQLLAPHSSQYQHWQGDLYLERHQGTYTSQARNKRYNRKMEIALHDLEFFAALALALTGAVYPADEIELIWKEILLYQFHDILPGSAIHRVYDESLARYENLLNLVNEHKERILRTLAGEIGVGGPQNRLLIVNSNSWQREEWLKFGVCWYRVQVPAMGFRVIDLNIPITPPSGMSANSGWLENDQLRIEWAKDGGITRIFDKLHHYEVLAGGENGNRLAVYQDEGDAWDIPIGYLDRQPEYFHLTDVSYHVDGPVASVKHRYDYGNSVLEQEIVLCHGSRRVDFITKVNWQERNKMLRVAFPLTIRDGEALAEIQFGCLRRPNHRNTTWEMAKYEICAHKWIDLSNSGYGAALLNDCKYGHRVYENILDLNLLRSPTYPDPEADRGIHEFTYALYPHSGNHLEGRVLRRGYELNYPLFRLQLPPSQNTGSIAREFSLITVQPENIVIETVKKAEGKSDPAAALIIRLYESAGCSTGAKIDIHLPFSSVELVDLMEEPYQHQHFNLGSGRSGSASGIDLQFGPFEIHTLKVRIGNSNKYQ